jgi:hypothetical protein
MNECQFALRERLGRPPLREGTNDPYGWGASGQANAQKPFKAADGHWLMVSLPSLRAKLASEASPELWAADLVGSLDHETALKRLAEIGIEAARAHNDTTTQLLREINILYNSKA